MTLAFLTGDNTLVFHPTAGATSVVFGLAGGCGVPYFAPASNPAFIIDNTRPHA
jgi:hypothetical protein